MTFQVEHTALLFSNGTCLRLKCWSEKSSHVFKCVHVDWKREQDCLITAFAKGNSFCVNVINLTIDLQFVCALFPLDL